MTRLFIFVLFCGALILFGLATTSAQGVTRNLAEQSGPGPSGRPGWPMPAKPIPHHEPGHISKASSFTARGQRLNEEGSLVTVQLEGLDAMAAAGEDPFAGNYTLVSSDQLMRSIWGGTNHMTYKTLTVLPTPMITISQHTIENSSIPANDLAAGDLNGDGQFEQISAWMDAQSHLYLSVGEIPGSPGKSTSAPAAVAGTNIHLLARGYDNSLWHCSYDVGLSSCNWDTAGGVWLSAPAVASLGTDQFEAFVIGTDNEMYGRHWASGWSGNWQQYGDWPFPAPAWTVPLPELPAPAAVARGSGTDLFRLSPENTLYWYNGTNWQNLGGMLASGPAVVSLSENYMQVFARGLDDTLWTITYNSGWGTWQRLELDGMSGIRINSAPAVVSPAANQIAVYVRGSDNQIWSALYDGGGWGSWTAGGGELASAPGATVQSGAVYLFAQTTAGLLQESHNPLTWQNLGGPPSCCTERDTGITPSRHASGEFLDHTLDIETGYFWGDGRSQTVLGYFSTGNQEVVLYDLSDNREDPPFTLEPVAQLTRPNRDWSKLTTGDFLDHDGQDDIAIASVTGNNLEVEILRFSRETRTLSVVETDISSHSGELFEGTLDIAGGDFDKDGQDEIAVTTVFYRNSTNDQGGLCGSHGVWIYEFSTDIYDVNKTGSDYTLTRYREGWSEATVNDDLGDVRNVGLALAAGDLDGDGKDELIKTWPADIPFARDWLFDCTWNPINKYQYEVADRFYRVLQAITLPDNANPDDNTWTYDIAGKVTTPIATIPAYTQRSYTDRLATGDFDRDLVSEIVWQAANNTPGQTLYVYKRNSTGNYEQVGEKVEDWGLFPHLVAGAFTGESIRVGQPTYRTQMGMTSPEVFLNLPPMHRDILSGPTQLIQIDNGATAIYSAGNTQTDQSTSESKRDWSLSVGLEGSAGAAGSQVTASLDGTYGENFSKSDTRITTISYQDETTAQYYDQVIYNGTNYGIWEYPVTGVATSNPDQPATIAVVFPLVSTTTQPNTAQGRMCDENFYTPSHQPYNVWSYDRIGSVLFGDYDGSRLIEAAIETQGGTAFSIGMSTATETLRTDSFKNQISTGLEYTYENELEVPLIGQAWDVSFRASTKGDFALEEISTLASTFTQDTAVNVNFPGSPDPSTYYVKAYFYWAKAGYLVVDYQTQPVSGAGSWALYNKTDPAFILPWYGFPDPATGNFPPIPHPDAPPCGIAKQLFTHDIEIEPAYAQNGDSVTLTATARNFSFITPPSDVLVRFYLGAPSGGNQIASCSIGQAQLDRSQGPAACSTTWQVEGASGEEKIYAVIDPDHAFDEMHDEDDMINNNMGYGLLHAAYANYFDPGLRQAAVYQPFLYEEAPGLDYGLYIPTTNQIETVRYELVPSNLEIQGIIGVPVQVLAFNGGQQSPDNNHTFAPVPAGFTVTYNDADLFSSMLESELKLYRQDGSGWVEATCPGYNLYRFPADNTIAVPICETGTFILSDGAPVSENRLFLPIITK